MNNITKTNRNKLTCTVTGDVVRVAPKVFEMRAIKFGSVENLLSNYICMRGRRLLYSGKTVEQIRRELNVSDIIPLPSAEIVAKYTRWSKYRKEKNIVYEHHTEEKI